MAGAVQRRGGRCAALCTVAPLAASAAGGRDSRPPPPPPPSPGLPPRLASLPPYRRPGRPCPQAKRAKSRSARRLLGEEWMEHLIDRMEKEYTAELQVGVVGGGHVRCGALAAQAGPQTRAEHVQRAARRLRRQPATLLRACWAATAWFSACRRWPAAWPAVPRVDSSPVQPSPLLLLPCCSGTQASGWCRLPTPAPATRCPPCRCPPSRRCSRWRSACR